MGCDRTVHAEDITLEVVRYDNAGKWKIEYKHGAKAEAVSLSTAASVALGLYGSGRVYFGRSGGRAFDARVKQLVGELCG